MSQSKNIYMLVSYMLSIWAINCDAQVKYYSNRQEGNRSIPLNAHAAGDLVSFTLGNIEEYQYGKGAVLTVKFYSYINNVPLEVLGIDKSRRSKTYYMKSNPFKYNSGWAKFEPWQVDEFLTRQNIYAGSLGVVARYSGYIGNNTLRVSPAIVWHSSENNCNTYAGRYYLYFHTEYTQRVYYTVYKSDEQGNKKIITHEKKSKAAIGGKVEVDLDFKNIRDGYYLVEILFQNPGSVYKKSYLFYHKKP